MNKTLSISVAAYNVEQYLPKLFETLIIDEVIDDIEILIVNDGSTDNTAKLSLEYQEKYPNSVRLIDKKNGGHGSTINRGIVEAKGKYFRALDGDDWVNSSDFVKLIAKLKDDDSDMILTNFITCYYDGREETERFTGIESGVQYKFDSVIDKIGWMRYHTVIYKTEILQKNKIELDEHCFYVDSEFMIFPIPYIDTITYYNLSIYCYRLGIEGQSVSPASRMKHSDDSYKVYKSLFEMYNNLPNNISEKHKKYIEYGISGHCIWHFRTLMTFDASKQKKQELINYDKAIKQESYIIYKGMEKYGNTSRLIKVMRKSKYLMYGIICGYKNKKNSR